MVEILDLDYDRLARADVSVLYREPMWLKLCWESQEFGALPEFQCSTVSRCG